MTTQAGPVTPVDTPAPSVPTPRPTHLTAFVGRATELAEIGTLLGSVRLLTLTGGGGSGKTRLAAEFVSRSGADTFDEVAWVDLAALTDESLLARHVSAEFGLVEELGRPALDALAARIGRSRLLLVLDNCEHLVTGCAELCRTLLQSSPGLRILATSREALGVDGETAWLVPSLSLPPSDQADAADLDRSDAVQLFVDRARAVRPDFTVDDGNRAAVAHICRRLDGIPLAIELAAARTRVLTAPQIAERLDDLFGLLAANRRSSLPRHRTLREAIDWSYAMLDRDERVLFRRLAVFRDGWTIEAAEAICADDALPRSEILDLLTALVDKSLARADTRTREARFTFLEPVRQYAMGELRACGELLPLCAKHAAFFLDLAETAEPHVRGGTRNTDWMNRLEVEHANLRAALEWFGEADARVPDLLRLEVSLLWFHFAQGLFEEPRDRITAALIRVGDLSPRLRGQTLTALGYQSKWLGDFESARGPLEAGVELLRRSGDPEALSLALTGLGAVLGVGGDGAAAYQHFDEAQSALGGREACEAHGFPRLLLYAFASYWRGMVAQAQGDLPTARRAFEVSEDVARVLDGHPSIAHPLAALAHISMLEGDLDASARLFAESVQIHVKNGDRWALTRVFAGGARLAALRGDPERAARLLGASDRIRESMGGSLPPHERADRAQLIDEVRNAAGWEAFEKHRATGRTMTIERVAAELATGAPSTDSAAIASGRTMAPDVIAPELPVRSFPSQGVERQGGAHETIVHQSYSAPASTAPRVDLRVEALGPLMIYCGGEVVDGGRWGSAKPRELLLFLLTRPEGASRDQVGLALWPEATGDKVANNFHVTLHRLRKALGHGDWVVSSSDRYRVSPEIVCHFDAAVFEDRVRSALRDFAERPDAIDRLRTALDLYRGPLLEGEVVGDWHLDLRDRLARLHVEGLSALGDVLMRQERYAEAVEVFRRAIASDDLHEASYRQLMIGLTRSGDRPQALRLYQRLEALLANELDTQPEGATRELYDQLRTSAALAGSSGA